MVQFLTVDLVTRIHDAMVMRAGGKPGVRDAGALESAIARPLNMLAYFPEAPVVEAAAALGVGLARSHAFIDGNKRTALLAMRSMLTMNGYSFEPGVTAETNMMLALAAHEVSEEEFTAWVGETAKPIRAIEALAQYDGSAEPTDTLIGTWLKKHRARRAEMEARTEDKTEAKADAVPVAPLVTPAPAH